MPNALADTSEVADASPTALHVTSDVPYIQRLILAITSGDPDAYCQVPENSQRRTPARHAEELITSEYYDAS